jgi:hypothetical protein
LFLKSPNESEESKNSSEFETDQEDEYDSDSDDDSDDGQDESSRNFNVISSKSLSNESEKIAEFCKKHLTNKSLKTNKCVNQISNNNSSLVKTNQTSLPSTSSSSNRDNTNQLSNQQSNQPSIIPVSDTTKSHNKTKDLRKSSRKK